MAATKPDSTNKKIVFNMILVLDIINVSREVFYLVRLQERTQCSALIITEYIERIRQEFDANHSYSREQSDPSLGRNGLEIKQRNIWIILRVHLKYNPYIVRRQQTETNWNCLLY